MTVGDFAMLPRWPDYRIETGKGLERIEISEIAKRQSVAANYLRIGVGRPLRSVIGDGLEAARVLSGVVCLVGGNGRLTRGLPDFTLVRSARARLDPWLVFLSEESSAPKPGFGAVAERLVELIFIATLRDWSLQTEGDIEWKQRLTDPSISRALDAMHANPARHWTLRDLATASGRSRSGFVERFRTVMGETPFAYLALCRMRLASSLVKEGRLSTADVGVSLG